MVVGIPDVYCAAVHRCIEVIGLMPVECLACQCSKFSCKLGLRREICLLQEVLILWLPHFHIDLGLGLPSFGVVLRRSHYVPKLRSFVM